MRDRIASSQATQPLVVAVVVATLAVSALLALRVSVPLALLLCGAIAFALLLLRPALGLVAVAVLSFTLPVTLGTGSEVSLTTPVVLIPVLILAWLVDGMRNRTIRLPASPTTLPLLLFVGSGFLSLLAGTAYWDPTVPRPGNLLLVQLGQLAIFTLSAALFLVAADLGARGRWLERTTYAFLVAGALSVVAAFLLPGISHALNWPIARLIGSGMFWTWLAAMAVGQLLHNHKLPRLARLGLVFLLGASAYVVWISQHDWISGWLPFTVALLTVVWIRVWRRNRVAGLATGAALLVLAVLLYPLVFTYVGGERELQISWGGRQILYQAVFELVKKHPILGLGPAAYRHYAFTRWLWLGAGRALYVRPLVSSHNNYIDIYAQNGLVGLISFVWFLIALATVTWRLAPRFRGDFREGYVVGALGGLAGTFAAMTLVDWFLPFVYNVGFNGLRSSAIAWMFLGGVVALEQKAKSEATGATHPGET